MTTSKLFTCIASRTIELEAGAAKLWRRTLQSEWTRVEVAALRHFEAEGWAGYAGEGGLILSLIKAASFPTLPAGMHSHFIEALYYIASDEYRAAPDYRPPPPSLANPFDAAGMVGNTLSTDEDRLVANFAVMTGPGSSTLSFFPHLTLERLLGLYRALGNHRLHQIAALFAEDPYTLRKGWPDLTLWRGNEVFFCEVKAPGDKLQASQRKLMERILLPLGLEVQIVNVTPAQSMRV
ncbi:MAG: VRR-NUC domain-containing protein [Terracidiphilus sp.]|jgi:hypothetical protein